MAKLKKLDLRFFDEAEKRLDVARIAADIVKTAATSTRVMAFNLDNLPHHFQETYDAILDKMIEGE